MTANRKSSDPQPAARQRGVRTALGLAAASLLFLSFAAWGQEVVVFKDKRAEVVLGHRVDGGWTYLSVKDGEVGVPSEQIAVIRPATPEEIVSNVPTGPVAPESAASTESSAGGPPADEAPSVKPLRKIRDLRVQPGDAPKKDQPGEEGAGKLRSSPGKPSPSAKKKG